MNEKTLSDYLYEKRLTCVDFSKLINSYVDKNKKQNLCLAKISNYRLYQIKNKRDINMTAYRCNAIFLATQEKFGEGLDCRDYLNIN